MKNFNCFGSGKLAPFKRPVRIAAISGLLVGTVLTIGCTSNENKRAASSNETSTIPVAASQPVMPTPASSLTPAPAPATKKVVKKRPATVKYNDETYGVSFRYPWQYSVKRGEAIDSQSIPMDFVQQGGEAAVSIDMPKSYFPETDLASAFFRVSVNKNLSEAECEQFSAPQGSDKDAIQPSKLSLGGLELQEVEDIAGDDSKQDDTKYYHLFQNGACYEFALGLSTEDKADDDTMPVNREKVFRRLETILATVKVNPEAAPQVATGSSATPTSQEEAVK
ncbi:MAG: hypothetical protein JOZ80_16595 [Acidobacteriaceae bacterium]|nr:hypothetical protein [Acidobacteriaceae bacterium]